MSLWGLCYCEEEESVCKRDERKNFCVSSLRGTKRVQKLHATATAAAGEIGIFVLKLWFCSCYMWL